MIADAVRPGCVEATTPVFRALAIPIVAVAELLPISLIQLLKFENISALISNFRATISTCLDFEDV